MKKEIVIPVAGQYYHQKDLASVLTHKNRFYYAPDETIIEFARNKPNYAVYEYKRERCSLEIYHEPQNEHDPGALKVLANGVFIGYVPQDERHHLLEISMLPGLSMRVDVLGGPYKQVLNGELFNDSSRFKALMIFEYDA